MFVLFKDSAGCDVVRLVLCVKVAVAPVLEHVQVAHYVVELGKQRWVWTQLDSWSRLGAVGQFYVEDLVFLIVFDSLKCP